VVGTTNSSLSVAVRGLNQAGGSAIRGDAGGVGVIGVSQSNYGIWGYSEANFGVVASSSSGYGLYGLLSDDQ
jgi:hypothetical protein